MLHKNSRERYDKLKRDFHRLMRYFHRDGLDDFISTANSLRQWIRLDSAMSRQQKEALERFTVPGGIDWQICHQIANVQKHVRIRPGKAPSFVKAVQIKPRGMGFAVPPTMRVFGAGEEITIECDGRQECALAFVIRTFRHFHFIFEVAPIPVAQRTPDISSLTTILFEATA